MTPRSRANRAPLATLSVRIPAAQLRLLDAQAVARDTTVSDLVRQLLARQVTGSARP